MQMRYLMCNVPLFQGVSRRRKVPLHLRGCGPALYSFANVTILRDFSRPSQVRRDRCFDGLKPRTLDLSILSVGTFLTAFLARRSTSPLPQSTLSFYPPLFYPAYSSSLWLDWREFGILRSLILPGLPIGWKVIIVLL
jgi:hypothetical protein